MAWSVSQLKEAFKILGHEGTDSILVGGQALHVWCEYYQKKDVLCEKILVLAKADSQRASNTPPGQVQFSSHLGCSVNHNFSWGVHGVF
jgi:hypothetical protein